MMKLLVWVFCAFVLGINALTDEQKLGTELTGKECAAELGVSFDEVKQAWHGEDSDVDQDKLHCVSKCFLEKMDMLIDGVLQEDALIERLSSNVDRSVVEGIAAECHVEEIQDCEIAYNLFTCYGKHREELKL